MNTYLLFGHMDFEAPVLLGVYSSRTIAEGYLRCWSNSEDARWYDMFYINEVRMDTFANQANDSVGDNTVWQIT